MSIHYLLISPIKDNLICSFPSQFLQKRHFISVPDPVAEDRGNNQNTSEFKAQQLLCTK